MREREQAEQEADNLHDLVIGIGCLVGVDENAGNFKHKSGVSNLLFNISHQIDTIKGMIHIGSNAEYRLRNPDAYKRPGKAGGEA
jgi:hypothetical protein